MAITLKVIDQFDIPTINNRKYEEIYRALDQLPDGKCLRVELNGESALSVTRCLHQRQTKYKVKTRFHKQTNTLYVSTVPRENTNND